MRWPVGGLQYLDPRASYDDDVDGGAPVSTRIDTDRHSGEGYGLTFFPAAVIVPVWIAG